MWNVVVQTKFPDNYNVTLHSYVQGFSFAAEPQLRTIDPVARDPLFGFELG